MKLANDIDRRRFIKAAQFVGRLLKDVLPDKSIEESKERVKEAILKTANHFDLGSEYVKRLTEVCNTTLELDQIRAGKTLEEKLAEVPVIKTDFAEPKEVEADDFYEKKVAFEESGLRISDIWPQEKVALNYGYKGSEFIKELERVKRDLREEKMVFKQAGWDLMSNIEKVSKMVDDFEELETRMLALYGKEAENYLDSLADAIAPEKRGEYRNKVLLTDWDKEPFKTAAEGVRLSNKIAGIHRRIEKLKQHQKRAAKQLEDCFPEDNTVKSFLAQSSVKEAGATWDKDEQRRQERLRELQIKEDQLAESRRQFENLSAADRLRAVQSENQFETLSAADKARAEQAEKQLRQKIEAARRQAEQARRQEIRQAPIDELRQKQLRQEIMEEGGPLALYTPWTVKAKRKGMMEGSGLSKMPTNYFQAMASAIASGGLSKSDEKKIMKDINLDDVFTAEHENEVARIKATANFIDLITEDPILSEYPEEEVADMFNEVVSMYPEAAENKTLMRTILRRALESSKTLETSQIMQLIEKGEEEDEV